MRTNYSKEAARKKTGGELTAQGKSRVRENQGATEGFAGEDLKAGEIRPKRQDAGERFAREIQKQAERVVFEPATVDAYIATLYLLDVQTGLIRGYEYYVDKPWRAAVDLELVDWFTGYGIGHYTSYDTVSYDWAWVDTSVDAYQDITVSKSISEDEISSEESYAESESFDMSEVEEERVTAGKPMNKSNCRRQHHGGRLGRRR